MLCASHIISKQRYFLLLNTINNILNQTQPIDFYVSIYSIKSDLWFPDHEKLHIYQQTEPMSQFEHFNFLAERIDDPTHTFCLFCDDDDFSHPNRTLFYMSCEDFGQSVMFAHTGLLLIQDVDNVTSHSSERCKKMLHESKAECINGGEYFMYCVRLSQLILFCRVLKSHGYLKLNICDILFGSVLYHTEQKKLANKPPEWVYAYSSRPKERETEYQEYHKLVRDKELMNVLRKCFHIPETWKGKTTIYGEDDTEEYL